MIDHIASPPLQPVSTFDTIAKIVSEVMDVDLASIRPESKLEDDLDGDCLDRLDVINEIEIKFDLLLEDDVTAFATIGALASSIDEKIGYRAALHAGASEGLR